MIIKGKFAMKCLIAHPEICVGCRNCLYACSYQQEDFFDPLLSRIQVYFEENSRQFIPCFCLQCGENAACISACPSGALKYDLSLNAVLWEKKACINCRMCVQVCPYNAIKADILTNAIMKCDLCYGNPVCIQVCPTKAIEFVEMDEKTDEEKSLHSQVMKDFFTK